jgi:hypothetical protein
MTRRQARLQVNSVVKCADPMLLNDFLTLATNKVATDCDAYYIDEEFDLDGSVATPFFKFCAPEIYKVKTWRYLDANGIAQRGDEICNPYKMEEFARYWRTDDRTGNPLFLIVERPNFYLWPRPTWTVTAGVTIGGFAIPGDSWPDEDDLFPLPAFAWDAVLYKAIYLWESMGSEKPNLARKAEAEKLHEKASGVLDARLTQEWSGG